MIDTDYIHIHSIHTYITYWKGKEKKGQMEWMEEGSAWCGVVSLTSSSWLSISGFCQQLLYHLGLG
jgi:hypothetical protein